MGVAENIDALLVKYDITQEALGRIAGISQAAVSGWRHGKKPSNSSVRKLCDYFGLEPNDILSDKYGLAQQEHNPRRPFSSIPVYSTGRATVPLLALGRIHAGVLADEETAEREIEVPASLIEAHPNARAGIADGECMNKVIPNGAAFVFDPDLSPSNNSIVVAETQDYQAIVRRWFKGTSTLMLVADSFLDFEDIVITGDDPIKVLGVVFWWQSAGEFD